MHAQGIGIATGIIQGPLKSVAAGVPLGDVAGMAGNSAAEIAKTYMHDSEETKKRSREMAQRMFAAQGLDQDGNPKKPAIE
jgi:hypothetical protein